MSRLDGLRLCCSKEICAYLLRYSYARDEQRAPRKSRISPAHGLRLDPTDKNRLVFDEDSATANVQPWHYDGQGWPHLPDDTADRCVPADFPHSLIGGHTLLRL
jgi:hypothetical protein